MTKRSGRHQGVAGGCERAATDDDAGLTSFPRPDRARGSFGDGKAMEELLQDVSADMGAEPLQAGIPCLRIRRSTWGWKKGYDTPFTRKG